jgi:uncharacterized membrane protein YcaP (DUF421 family)
LPTLDELFKVDWRALFVPELGLAELVLRGTLMYLAIFMILRFMGNRSSGKLGPADLLVITLIADAAQNALGADYRSVPEGVVLVLTIVAWDYAIDWLQYNVPALRPLLEPRPLQLIRDGRMNRKNMRAELITPEELMAQLREQGIERIEEVKQACLETNGSLSVIKRRG